MTETARSLRAPIPSATPWPSSAATTYTLFCPSLDTSPLIARDFVATVLRALGLDTLVDAAALCTSELVTNACVHARGGGSVLWLAVEAWRVRVIVFDGDENPPVMRELTPGGWEEGGRGLYLVDALTEGHWGTAAGHWGTAVALPHDGGLVHPDGKAVWFDLAAPDQRPTARAGRPAETGPGPTAPTNRLGPVAPPYYMAGDRSSTG
ncbi:ATP-binding protein [Streptomyces caniscabiei]|uniref:ATP-binding protein n=1 Tax=Streptomyces caniscabiei TaxID=2746961 RepID=UPI0029A8DF36|nr:ATP-binding protein [Streptomyces caniscabiei]MDX2606586.1 ATP-binding protein [Streptomyces caniscabiei]MDX2739524.1 ATP-binding protein [Streptomyces caniscabiei]MDX2783688.1 ATP-binding protein [Streptomyces caniscabiei]